MFTIKRCIVLLLIAIFFVIFQMNAVADAKGIQKYRWVFISNSLSDNADLKEVKKIINTAADHGLNGVVLSADLDAIDLKDDEFKQRLEKVKDACDERNMELIPQVLSMGWGGGLLEHDLNFAEGLPVRDAMYTVEGDQAFIEPNHDVQIYNGGIEEYEDDTAAGFLFRISRGK